MKRNKKRRVRKNSIFIFKA